MAHHADHVALVSADGDWLVTLDAGNGGPRLYLRLPHEDDDVDHQLRHSAQDGNQPVDFGEDQLVHDPLYGKCRFRTVAVEDEEWGVRTAVEALTLLNGTGDAGHHRA